MDVTGSASGWIALLGCHRQAAIIRPLLSTALAAGCLLATATDAMACRTVVPRADDLARMRILQAVVEHSERVEAPGWNTWRIVATATDAGDAARRPTFEFRVTLSSSGCGRTPLPPAGERWVLYLDQTDPGKVLQAFPLDQVKDHDPRLASLR